MRGLVITLALFVILLGIITVNSIFVEYSVQKMRYTVENLQLIPNNITKSASVITNPLIFLFPL